MGSGSCANRRRQLPFSPVCLDPRAPPLSLTPPFAGHVERTEKLAASGADMSFACVIRLCIIHRTPIT